MPPVHHLCNRETCPSINVNGPKAKCVQCGKFAYLMCYGFTKYGSDSVELRLSNGTKIRMSTSSFVWKCQTCTAADSQTLENDVIETITTSTQATNDTSIQTTLNEIKELIENRSAEIIGRLDEIGPCVKEAAFITKGIDRKIELKTRDESTSVRGLANDLFKRPFESGKSTVNQNQTPRSRPLYSTILQKSTPVTPQPSASAAMSSKRKRNAEIVLIDNASEKMVTKKSIPSPKNGTKNVQIGKPLEQRKIEPKKVNKLSESIWLSGFHPETSSDEIDEYIIQHTAVADKTKFKSTKLVKKDQDITKMSFVSFKIDVLPEDYDLLVKPENWPQQIKVREFIRMTPPKPTLDQFMSMPAINSPTNSPIRESKQMRTGNESENDTSINSNDILRNEQKMSPPPNATHQPKN